MRVVRGVLSYLRWFWQWLIRGFSDRQLWSLDVTIAKFVVPRLKALKAYQHGHPNEYTEEGWDEILDKMIWSFEYSLVDIELPAVDSPTTEETVKDVEAQVKRYEEGMVLFAKHFSDLWD